MSDPANTLELALRLRRDAETTCLPEYACLMRRAADELETFVRFAGSSFGERERRAG